MKITLGYKIASATAGFALVLVFLFAPQRQTIAQSELDRIELLELIKLGDSSGEIDKKIGRLFVGVHTNRYLPQHPFRDLLPYTNNALISEWRSKDAEEGNWPEIVFAVFSDARKTNLVDALWFRSQNVRPLVDGLYSQRLTAVRVGDSMEKLFSQVGQRECKYFLSKDGKWRVRFFYWGHEGKMIAIEADAATGLVVRVSDSTI